MGLIFNWHYSIAGPVHLKPGPHLPVHIPSGPQAGFVWARAGSLGLPVRAPFKSLCKPSQIPHVAQTGLGTGRLGLPAQIPHGPRPGSLSGFEAGAGLTVVSSVNNFTANVHQMAEKEKSISRTDRSGMVYFYSYVPNNLVPHRVRKRMGNQFVYIRSPTFQPVNTGHDALYLIVAVEWI